MACGGNKAVSAACAYCGVYSVPSLQRWHGFSSRVSPTSPGADERESRRTSARVPAYRHLLQTTKYRLAPKADWRRLGARCGSDVRWASRRLLLGACAAGVERSRLSLKAAPRGARGCCHAWLGRRRRLRMSSCRWASVPCGRSTVWRGDEYPWRLWEFSVRRGTGRADRGGRSAWRAS